MAIDEYAKILYKLVNCIAEDQQDLALDLFIKLLVKKKVISKIDLIVEKFSKQVEYESGPRNIELILARKSEIDLDRLLIDLFGEKVEYRLRIDPDIIGGMVIEEDNIRYDASIKTQLSKLKDFLD